MRARVRDTEIFFDVDGAALVHEGVGLRERATAFVVHGGPGIDHTASKLRYAALSTRMQLVYFDHRGHGRSARGDANSYTLENNVEDMEALRRHLGLGQIVSIGTSYGGMVAMAHAARYPEAISHLVLVATISHAGYVQRAEALIRQRGTPEQIEACEEMFAGRLDTPEKLQRYFERTGPLYSHSYQPQSGGGFGPTILEPKPFNQAHGPTGFLRTLDLRPQLRHIRAPTLIIAGRHDWICAPEFSEEIHRLIPGSDLRIFENSSHTVAADEPQRFLDAVAGFIVYQEQRVHIDAGME